MKVVPSKGMEDFLKLLILNCSLMLKNTNCYNLLIIHLIRYRPTLRPDYKSSKIITNKSNYKGDVRLVISIYAMYVFYLEIKISGKSYNNMRYAQFT